jgi:hypothetical protein
VTANISPTYRSGCVPLPVHKHGSEAWLIERGNTIGASEVGMVIGVSPYGGLLELVQRKRAALAGNVEQNDSPAMADGRDAEDTILRMARRRIGAPHLKMRTGEEVAIGRDSATPDAIQVQQIQTACAGVPWVLYQDPSTAGGKVEEIPVHPILDLIRRPNPEQGQAAFAVFAKQAGLSVADLTKESKYKLTGKATVPGGPKKADVIIENARFDIKQAFAEGYDPDRIAAAFVEQIGSTALYPGQSGFAAAGTGA